MPVIVACGVDAGVPDGSARSVDSGVVTHPPDAFVRNPDAGSADAGSQADAAARDAGSSVDAGSSGTLDGGPLPERDVIFVAVDGDDARDGRTFATAVATLDRAQAILFAERPDRAVAIRVAPGDYRCRELTEPWTYVGTHPVTIEPMEAVPSPAVDSWDHPNRPRFWGVTEAGTVCRRSVFFNLHHGRVRVDLTIRGIAIRHYRGGISLVNPAAVGTRVDQNVIVDNVAFVRIGDFYHRTASGLIGKGAVLLTYTYGNTFRNNYFFHIRNDDPSPGAIHAFYFTNRASRNVVEDNVFQGHSGSIVKLTDYSNANVFRRNRFSNAPVAIVDRWCGAREDPVGVCPGDVAQCPSWDNRFSINASDPDRNYWSSLSFAEPYVVYPIPEGQTCGVAPARSGVRMDLGGGDVIR